jgi:hypothetical protein
MASYEDRLLVAETMLASFDSGEMPDTIGALDDDVKRALVEETAKRCGITLSIDGELTGTPESIGRLKMLIAQFKKTLASQSVPLSPTAQRDSVLMSKADHRAAEAREAVARQFNDLSELVKAVRSRPGAAHNLTGAAIERLRHWRDRTIRLLAKSVRASDIARLKQVRVSKPMTEFDLAEAFDHPSQEFAHILEALLAEIDAHPEDFVGIEQPEPLQGARSGLLGETSSSCTVATTARNRRLRDCSKASGSRSRFFTSRPTAGVP